MTSLGGKKVVTVHTTKATIVRRYAPDSIQFDEAKPSTLADIKPGDQLRARGDRNDGMGPSSPRRRLLAAASAISPGPSARLMPPVAP